MRLLKSWNHIAKKIKIIIDFIVKYANMNYGKYKGTKLAQSKILKHKLILTYTKL